MRAILTALALLAGMSGALMRWLLAPLLWLLLACPASAQQSFNYQGYCQLQLSVVIQFSGGGVPNPCSTGSIPVGVKFAEICVSTSAIRYSSNGSSITPSATIGIPVPAGTCFPYSGNIYSIAFANVTSGAVIDIEFFQ